MNPFQRAYDYLKSLKTPDWLKRLLGMIEEIAVEVFTQIGEEAKNYLKEEIYRQAKLEITGRKKLDNVITGFREKYAMIAIGNYALNLAIELLLGELKKSEVLD